MNTAAIDGHQALAIGSIGCAVVACVALLALHVLSPEFQPSWRMVSEYALGRHKWLITLFFAAWGVSSLVLAALLWPLVEAGWARAGVILLVVSGIGELMGGLFDVKHAAHGLAFLLGVPTLPIAALLVGYHLATLGGWDPHRGALLFASHATWISLVLMAIAMFVMMAGFRKAGFPMGPDAPVPERVPDGVIALAGYANRGLVACYLAWLMVVARAFLAVR